MAVKGRTSRPTPSSFRWGDSWVFFLRSHSHHFKTALGIEWMRRRSWLRWQSATTIIDFMYGTENQITSTFTISGAFCARLTFTFTLEDLEEADSSVWVDREAHSTQKLKKRCNFLLLLHIKRKFLLNKNGSPRQNHCLQLCLFDHSTGLYSAFVIAINYCHDHS